VHFKGNLSTTMTTQTSAGTKRAKGRNMTADEDQRLCRAWLAISQDAITSDGQKMTTFWDRITCEFNTIRLIDASTGRQTIKRVAETEEDYRPSSTLASRWSRDINKKVSKFAGCVAKSKSSLHSGWSDSQYYDFAKELYRDSTGKEFTLDGCYQILSASEKWNCVFESPSIPNSQVDIINNAIDDTSNVSEQIEGGQCYQNDTTPSILKRKANERPPGIKYKKNT
jgi:hypothetical protein